MQAGTTADMFVNVPSLISFVSGITKLEKGDLILTGTPPGVGRICPGDKFEAKLTSPGLDGQVLSEYAFDCRVREGGYHCTV